MTTRKTLLIDRTATALLALLALLAGATAVWWWSGEPLAGRRLAPALDLTDVRTTAATTWFAWTAAAVGVVLARVGARWIAAHLIGSRVHDLTLPGADSTGRLDVAAGKVVSAAADALADTVGVRSARGVIVRERGRLVARISVIAEPDADLSEVAQRCDEIAVQLGQALGREDLRCTVDIRAAARGRTTRAR